MVHKLMLALTVIISQYGPNQYGLVVYGTISHTPEPAVQYVKETRDAKQILQFLNEVRLVSSTTTMCIVHVLLLTSLFLKASSIELP